MTMPKSRSPTKRRQTKSKHGPKFASLLFIIPNFSTTMSAPAPAPAPAATKPVLLPQKGTARVKNVMSGDTVVLWGKAPAPNVPPPQVQFTLEGLMAPRCVNLM